MMITTGQKSLPAIGFLTITRDREHGLFGGYLVLNAVGRPLEFHCTAPVLPNRAQEILYGPTLEPYLCGERIGTALLDKSKLSPAVVFTDVQPAMAMRRFVSTPLILVLPRPAPEAKEGTLISSLAGPAARPGHSWRHDPSHSTLRSLGRGLRHFDYGGYHLAFSEGYPQDRESVDCHWPQFADQIDLEEPFGRIRDAIDEARNSVR